MGSNIHLFLKLGNRMFQDERAEKAGSNLTLPRSLTTEYRFSFFEDYTYKFSESIDGKIDDYH